MDKEAYVQGICEGVEHLLWSSDSHPAYRGIRSLRSSKPIPWCTAVRAEGGGLLTEESEVKARRAGYFGRLFQADPPAVELDVRGVTIPIAWYCCVLLSTCGLRGASDYCIGWEIGRTCGL